MSEKPLEFQVIGDPGKPPADLKEMGVEPGGDLGDPQWPFRWPLSYKVACPRLVQPERRGLNEAVCFGRSLKVTCGLGLACRGWSRDGQASGVTLGL